MVSLSSVIKFGLRTSNFRLQTSDLWYRSVAHSNCHTNGIVYTSCKRVQSSPMVAVLAYSSASQKVHSHCLCIHLWLCVICTQLRPRVRSRLLSVHIIRGLRKRSLRILSYRRRLLRRFRRSRRLLTRVMVMRGLRHTLHL